MNRDIFELLGTFRVVPRLFSDGRYRLQNFLDKQATLGKQKPNTNNNPHFIRSVNVNPNRNNNALNICWYQPGRMTTFFLLLAFLTSDFSFLHFEIFL